MTKSKKDSKIVGNRVNLYMSPKRDKDLINYVENCAEIEIDDLSYGLRELMRDGIRYRQMMQNGQQNVVHQIQQPSITPVYKKVSEETTNEVEQVTVENETLEKEEVIEEESVKDTIQEDEKPRPKKKVNNALFGKLIKS